MQPRETLRSPLLTTAGFRHAFFTRHGGVSTGAYASLNFSRTVGDAESHVTENLERAARALDVPRDHLFYLNQVHGAEVVVLSAGDTVDALACREGDALAVIPPPPLDGAVAVGVRVADCVPVLLGDRRSGAVAAIHAGWRGVVAGVIGTTVEVLRSRLQGALDPVAAIGPHISATAFEVGEEVAAALGAIAPERAVILRPTGRRPHVDLRALVREQLQRAGLAAASIDDVEGCTYHEPERFFSFRRDGAHSGRHLAAIVTREQALP